MRRLRSPLMLMAVAVFGAGILAQGPPAGAPQTPAPGAPPAPVAGAPANPAAGRQGGRGGGGGRGGRGVAVQPGQECPPGMTRSNPNSCSTPEFPVPSIVDYRPHSTLVAAEHKVPKAKYGAIDYHAHVTGAICPGGRGGGRGADGPPNVTNPCTQDALATLVKDLDSVGVALAVAADSVTGERLKQVLDVVRNSPHKDRVRVLTGINFSGVGPGWAEKAVAQLEADVKAGAVGIGEISKSLGLTTRKPDGTRLKVDDPALDPVWAAAGRLNIPVFIHTAEPQEFFQQPDMHNERWLELALFGDRRNYMPGQVTFEELMTERDNMIRRNPKTRFVVAHFGWHANNLARAAKMLDTFPNVVFELGAVLYDFGRQPRAAREFFTKYQDRILFGKDTFEPSEFPYYWRVFETADEYFDYYPRTYHAFWKMYGMDLPDAVLRKVYYANALKVTPGLPQSGWPRR